MERMEEKAEHKGGILADDMGLGKTIQRLAAAFISYQSHGSIALILSSPSKDRSCKTTLICTPLALLGQWRGEIRTKTDPALNVHIHHPSWHGQNGEKITTAQDLLQYDVVLTTYTMIVT
jgi:SNF2 family DNA or RNA helicase